MCYAGYFERDSRRSLLVGEVDRGRGGLRSNQLGAPAALNPTLACEGLPIPKVGACSGLLRACGDGGSTVFLKVNCLRVCTSSCFLLLLHLLLVSSLGLPPSTSSTAVCSYVWTALLTRCRVPSRGGGCDAAAAHGSSPLLFC